MFSFSNNQYIYPKKYINSIPIVYAKKIEKEYQDFKINYKYSSSPMLSLENNFPHFINPPDNNKKKNIYKKKEIFLN